MKLGLLHPGAMGVSVGTALQAAGHEVLWLPEGRSAATRQRAESAGFTACQDLAELTDRCAGIVSVCPPHGALALAATVVDIGFDGTYLDANAVSPATAREIHGLLGERLVDALEFLANSATTATAIGSS